MKVELIALVNEGHMRLQMPWWENHRTQNLASTTHTTLSGAMRQKKHNKKKGSGTRSGNKKRDSNNNKNTTTFPFMRLPPELRNMIYELALPMHQSYVPIAPSAPEAHAIVALSCFRPIAVPALLATSRTIRNEALPMFYGNNTFNLGLGEDLSGSDEKQFRSTLAWLESTDPRGIASMTTLSVTGATKCVSEKHVHVFAAEVDLVRPEPLVETEKLFVEGLSVCPRAAARIRFATKVAREYALWRAAKDMPNGRAKVELVGVMRKAHRGLHPPWWTCVVKVKPWWVLLVAVIAVGLLYLISRIVA
ncbi:hypothetical protein LTR56_003787 [Elasticomyces elasticus]|nr:hypothetical protein LTR22_013154 [Elasticomyces elasticus]KAK3654929.1 hypothetical protein LTR56_003787 [Elasticomyces elasticus]KAK4928741.1 hypothetical protein LTR49_004550 [Elasticomyces elasticus]KAK5766632.1 hypothetical protein LTS12_003251 [Elasticomyces elasticus]